MVVGLPFCWWYVPNGFEETPVVEPVDVLEGGVFDLVEVTPRGPLADKFRLVEADHRLGEGVIVRVARSAGLAASSLGMVVRFGFAPDHAF